MSPALDPAQDKHPPKASELLVELLGTFNGDGTVTVQEILDSFENRAFGLLLLLLALPNCIPNIPGVSTIFGLLLLAPAIQMIVGAKKPWIPKGFRRLAIQRETFRKTIEGSLPGLRRVEKLVQPRWEFLTERPLSIALGIQVLILAAILALPIPFGNWLPGMAIAAIALAMLQRDGVFVIVGFGFFIASFAMLPLGIAIGIAAIQVTLDWLSGGWMDTVDFLGNLFQR